MDIVDWLLDSIVSGEVADKRSLQRQKVAGCRKFGIDALPKNSTILARAREKITDLELLKNITRILQKKRTRTISGVAPVAVMTSPADCPHGKCICCPGGLENNTPQSYTGKEPAALRGALNNFDPYLQTWNRLKQLHNIGHSIAKIDLIIMGGTFPARKPEYQNWFVKRCFDALNGEENRKGHGEKNKNGGSGWDVHDLARVQILNETAQHRCIGITIETRPDHCLREHVDNMLHQGATRVELGAQSTRDRALKMLGRGHTVADTIKATQILKDGGLKVCYHIMPGIPGERVEDDLEMFGELFSNPDFRPDMIKIYPLVVIEGCELHRMWEENKFTPYSLEQTTCLVGRMKTLVPPWVRIQRIQRDIPANMISDGIKYTNLRQIVRRDMAKKGLVCRCIRCREWGHNIPDTANKPDEKVEIEVVEYRASKGTEFFLEGRGSVSNLLHGYLRLRFPDNEKVALVRELKVVGPALELGSAERDSIQHGGVGSRLLEVAENIGKRGGRGLMKVTAGVGVREYYRKRGYALKEYHMTKEL